MTDLDAIRERHSVRQYLDQPLRPEEIAELTDEVRACNREGGLHIQLVTNEPKAFNGFMAHYGKFSGVANYFALVGKSGAELDEPAEIPVHIDRRSGVCPSYWRVLFKN